LNEPKIIADGVDFMSQKKVKNLKGAKNSVVAFKVPSELADFLNKLENKSAFIRKAIAAQVETVCPLCRGAGRISGGLRDHFAILLQQYQSRICDGCGTSKPLPSDSGELTLEHQSRLEQVIHGGPMYSDECYDKAPASNDCGMHINVEQVAEHHRKAHDN